MNFKKFIKITIVVTIISLILGVISLFAFSNNLMQLGQMKLINVRSDDNKVQVSPEGIFIEDDENTISIGWNGIKIKSSNNDDVDINWGNIITSKIDVFDVNLNETKSASLENINIISIDPIFIDTVIIPSDVKEVEISLTGKLKGDVDPKLSVNTLTNKLEIKIDYDRSTYSIMESDAILTIKLPKDYNGDIETATSSADMKIRDLTLNNLVLTTSSGDIELYNINSNSILSTASSGDIDMINVSGNIKSTSSSGDIELDLNENSKNIEIETSSGDVEVSFQGNNNYSIKGKTNSGEIQLPYNASINEQNKKDFSITLGNGINTMEIQTSSGDITLE